MIPRPYRQKPTPAKPCAWCGTMMERKRYRGVLESNLAFSRRKYCDAKCMGAAFDARPSRATTARSSRWHSSKAIPKGPCQRCGNPKGMDVHHRDGNPMNNAPENLERICRGCHTKEHRGIRVCSVPSCGRKHRRNGYCTKHEQRVARWGSPFAFKRNGATPMVFLAD